MSDVYTPAVVGLPLLDRWDTRMIQELALGAEPAGVILARYQIPEDQHATALADPVLKGAVDALTAELRRAGTTAKVKARIAAEELISLVFQRARQSKSLGETLDAFKALAKVGDLEPRDTQGKLTGTIVRVDLNIGQLGFPPAAAVTIHTTPAEVTEDAQNLEILDGDVRVVAGQVDELPGGPAASVFRRRGAVKELGAGEWP